jgi:hypothetical protein
MISNATITGCENKICGDIQKVEPGATCTDCLNGQLPDTTVAVQGTARTC